METKRIIRPSMSYYFINSWFFIGGFLYILYYFLFGHVPLSLLIESSALLVVFLVWLISSYIQITPDGISYHFNFWQQNSLSWSEIGSIALSAPKGQAKENYSTITLFSSNPSRKNVRLNIRMLSKENVQEIAQLLVEKVSPTRCDEATQQLAKGLLPDRFVSKKRQAG